MLHVSYTFIRNDYMICIATYSYSYSRVELTCMYEIKVMWGLFEYLKPQNYAQSKKLSHIQHQL